MWAMPITIVSACEMYTLAAKLTHSLNCQHVNEKMNVRQKIHSTTTTNRTARNVTVNLFTAHKLNSTVDGHIGIHVLRTN